MSEKLTYEALEQRVRELEASQTLREPSPMSELIESIQAGIVVHGRDGTVLKSNTTAQVMLGFTHEQILGKKLSDPAWTFLREDGSPLPVEEYPVSRVIATKKSVHNIVTGIQRSDDAEPIWVLDTAIPEFDENGRIAQIVTTFMDISALKESEKKYRNLFENTMQEVHLWKLVRDGQGAIKTWRLVEVNPAALKAWGKSRADIIGKTANEIFSYDATEQFMPVVEKIISEGTPHIWEANFPPTGQFLHMTSVPFGEYFMSTGTDISGLKNTERKLREMLEFDALTQVYSRQHLLRQAERIFMRIKQDQTLLLCMMFDIDHFKLINDQYGHKAGDIALIAFSEVVSKNLRSNDIFGRLGGEEFLALVPEISLEAGQKLAERIRIEVERMPIMVGVDCVTMTVSVGISMYEKTKNLATFDELMERSDQALYLAKSRGRNRVCVDNT